MIPLFAVLAVLVFVAVLQVALDWRARSAAKPDRFYLHLEQTPSGPVVCDEDGRTLGGIRRMRYLSAHDAIDELHVEVLVRTRGRYLLGADTRRPSRIGPTATGRMVSQRP